LKHFRSDNFFLISIKYVLYRIDSLKL
jgi:hypothetical protein